MGHSSSAAVETTEVRRVCDTLLAQAEAVSNVCECLLSGCVRVKRIQIKHTAMKAASRTAKGALLQIDVQVLLGVIAA